MIHQSLFDLARRHSLGGRQEDFRNESVQDTRMRTYDGAKYCHRNGYALPRDHILLQVCAIRKHSPMACNKIRTRAQSWSYENGPIGRWLYSGYTTGTGTVRQCLTTRVVDSSGGSAFLKFRHVSVSSILRIALCVNCKGQGLSIAAACSSRFCMMTLVMILYWTLDRASRSGSVSKKKFYSWLSDCRSKSLPEIARKRCARDSLRYMSHTKQHSQQTLAHQK